MMTSQRLAKNKVFVGLSGGVDSSVSAALLKKAGFDVTGVFIKVWQPEWIECTWKEDRLDAMRVCAKLNIPFVEINLENEYKKEVVDYMISEYKEGKTPNPDVMCNRYVKFGGFYDWAIKNGADFVATGHYAQIHKDKNYKLIVGKDNSKDQTYFLWQLRKDQLPHILFPVGHLEKKEVRVLAKKFGLVTADKKDSQGLCFIGKIDFKFFLKNYLDTKPGDVLNENGEVIGSHDGAIFFTVGERHGFELNKNVNRENPYYVSEKNVDKNIIVVTNKVATSDSKNDCKEALITRINWISSEAPKKETKYYARCRYRQPLEEIVISNIEKDAMKIVFSKSQEFITPGQSMVIYSKGGECLGGGIIS